MISQRDSANGKVLLSACAIIESAEHDVLFMREGDAPYYQLWVLPGGYVKPDETVKQAVAREVKEETNLDVNPTELLGLYEDFLVEGAERINYVIAAYRVKHTGGNIIFSKEAPAYKWIPRSEVANETDIPTVFKQIVADIPEEHKSRFSFWRRK
jgi:ADP-ribose pyrophosphatase